MIQAEQSAAEIALESIKQDKELMEEADKPKGFGKGGKARLQIVKSAA